MQDVKDIAEMQAEAGKERSEAPAQVEAIQSTPETPASTSTSTSTGIHEVRSSACPRTSVGPVQTDDEDEEADPFAFIAEPKDLRNGRGAEFVVSAEKSNVRVMPWQAYTRDIQIVSL